MGEYYRDVELDDFAVVLSKDLQRMFDGITDGSRKCVRKACVAGRKAARDKASANFKDSGLKKRRGKSYAESLTYHTSQQGTYNFVGEIGSKMYPGLVHLLEKGHARVGGGIVAGRPHMITGKREADRKLVEEILDTVDRELK